jgi:hypothetical protein
MADFIKFISSALEEFTVDELIQLMYRLHCPYDYVYVHEAGKYGYSAYVWELSNTECAHKRLRAVKCKFLGGPPNEHRIYEGTLLSMLTDRVLNHACVEKKSLAEIGLV